MEKKYELLKDDMIKVDSKVLYRIRALKNFGDVKAGDLGGYIEREKNLSQYGNCWIYGGAKVYDNAGVFDDAEVMHHAIVRNTASIHDYAKVFGNAEVYGNALVYGYAGIFENANVCGDAKLFGNAEIYGNANVHGLAEVYDNAKVFGDAEVCGVTEVYGNAKISMNGFLNSNFNYCLIYNFGSWNRVTTFFMCKDGTIRVNCGCFCGTLDEFRSKVKETHKDSAYAKEYLMAADLTELRLK